MKRRTIAICVTGYDYEYESRIVEGVYKRCIELDTNLLSFSPMTRKLEQNADVVLSDSVVRGETEIYELIDFDNIDGLILIGDSFIVRDSISYLNNKAKEHGVPVVNINDPELLDHNVILSDKIAMQFPVRHLIRDHGKKRIGFIGGFVGNLQTEERLEAYKTVLAENAIPFDEALVTYGEFWKKAADCTEQLMSLDNKPDAIVCASDSMGFFCMDKLKEMGYRIPEDVAVTGFDGIKDCDMCSPTLTSVKRDHERAGVEAVNILSEIWEGKTPEKVRYVDSKLIIKQSCGCSSDLSESTDFYTKHYAEINLLKEFNSYTTHANAIFAGAQTSVDLFSVMSRGADFFRLNRMFVCIDPDLENGTASTVNGNNAFIGFNDTMLSMVEYGHNVPVYTVFETKKMVPTDILNEDKPVFFGFSPMYFKNRSLGYVAFEPTKVEGQGDLLGIWLMNVSHNAGSFYMNKELEMLYVKDNLTGLYNRHGMELFGPKLLENAKKKNEKFAVICIDIDRLKPINDTYGHEGGDIAISKTAEAIHNSMPKDSICVRTGGDEFCVFAVGYTDSDIDGFISSTDEYLVSYNSTSGNPFTVSCSSGYVNLSASDADSIDYAMKIADSRMYDIKTKKKMMRES